MGLFDKGGASFTNVGSFDKELLSYKSLDFFEKRWVSRKTLACWINDRLSQKDVCFEQKGRVFWKSIGPSGEGSHLLKCPKLGRGIQSRPQVKRKGRISTEKKRCNSADTRLSKIAKT
jgi:hypothetical protein